jgi:hypothetical protein
VHVGSLRLASFLTSRGAEVNQRDQNGNTPLHFATYRCTKAILEEFINSTADGKPRLGLISSSQYLQIIEFLLNNNADATLRDDYGNTSLDLIQEDRIFDQRCLNPLKNILILHPLFKNTIRGNIIFSKLTDLGIQKFVDALDAEINKVLHSRLQHRLDF